jgi:hypothetical protein
MKKYAPLVLGTSCPRCTFHTRLTIVACLLCAFVLAAYSLPAQSYASVNLRELGYVVSLPEVVLMEGESIEAIIEVGSAAAPVRSAIGYDIWVELSSEAKWTASLSPNMTNSWMAEPSIAATETHDAMAPNHYRYQFLKTDPVDGSGRMLKLRLTANEDYVHTSHLIQKVGGLMQIDNLELRIAGSQPVAAALSIWPNPAIGAAKAQVQLYCKDAPVTSVKLLNLGGVTLSSYGPTEVLDLSTIAAGTYILQVTNQLGQVMHQKMVLY